MIVVLFILYCPLQSFPFAIKCLHVVFHILLLLTFRIEITHKYWRETIYSWIVGDLFIDCFITVYSLLDLFKPRKMWRINALEMKKLIESKTDSDHNNIVYNWSYSERSLKVIFFYVRKLFWIYSYVLWYMCHALA